MDDFRRGASFTLGLHPFSPAGKNALHEDDGVVEHDAQKGEGDQHREHQRIVSVGLARFEQRAEPSAVRRNDLDQIGADKGERDGDLQRAEKLRQGFRAVRSW